MLEFKLDSEKPLKSPLLEINSVFKQPTTTTTATIGFLSIRPIGRAKVEEEDEEKKEGKEK